MTSRRVMLVCACGLLLVGGAMWTSYQSLIAGPVRAARMERDALVTQITAIQRHTRDATSDRKALATVVGQTLGHDSETVIHRLRVALTAIGKECGLESVVVDSKDRGAVDSPASKAFSSKPLRDASDFYDVEGTIRGEGSVQAAASMLALLESQPWPKRIRSVTIDSPQGGKVDGRDRVTITAVLDTLYFHDSSPKVTSTAVGLSPMTPDQMLLASKLMDRNIFVRPVGGVVATKPEMPKAPPPAGAGWIITGWAQGTAGWELWLRSTRDQKVRSLPAGQSVDDVEFVGVQDGSALVNVGGQRYAIGLGEPLDARDHRID